MNEVIITRNSSEFKELRRHIIHAIKVMDMLIDTHRPAIGNEVYLTGEEVRSTFGISKRSLQNYRDNRQIPYTSIGEDTLSSVRDLQVVGKSLCSSNEMIHRGCLTSFRQPLYGLT